MVTAVANSGTIDGTTPSEAINDLVHESMLNYEQAIKTGIQLQENSVKVWRDLLAKAGSMEEIQRRLDLLSEDVFPNLRKHLDELLESSELSLMLVNRTGTQMFALMGKTVEIYKATSIAEGQRRLQDLVDSSLASMRENIPTMVTAHAKIIRSWKGLVELSPIQKVFASAPAFPPGQIV